MKKPNILFILSDDQGAWAFGRGGTPELHTPNLDKIAEQGMQMNSFFCASPVCSPARASLLTGRIPSQHGVHDWIRSGNVDADIFKQQGEQNPYGGYADERKPIQYLAGQTAYTDILAEHGYHCALSGKWHLGDSITPQHGFREWYTIGKGGCHYYRPDIVENGKITVKEGEYVTELITDKALLMLDQLSADAETPFYLSVHYTAPHSPWGAEHHPKKWIDYYDSCDFASIPDVPDHPDMAVGKQNGRAKRHENLRGYFAAVSAMDEQIGRILAKLEEKGLSENTVLIFAADNGMNMGHHGIWGKGNGTFPLNMYDTSVKVPFLIAYPPLIQAGSMCEEMVSAYDFFPTLLDLLGLSSELPAGLPGKSFLPLLKGEEADGRESVVIFDEYGPVRMIRQKEWKYVHHYAYGQHELYHLAADPGEEHNLYGQPEYEEKVLELHRQLDQWYETYADPKKDGLKEEVTGLGQLCLAGSAGTGVYRYYPWGDQTEGGA